MAKFVFIKTLLPKNRDWLRLTSLLSLSGLFATSALVIDANMVAPIGPEILAGLGLASSILALFMACLFGIGSAAQIILSKLIKQQQAAGFEKTLALYLLIGLLICVPLMLLAKFNIGFLVNLLASTSGVGFAASHYLHIIIFVMPISFCCFLLSSSLSVRKRLKEELTGFAIEMPINLTLNAVLIYGLFGVPALGIKGAAYATIVALLSRCLYLLWATRKDRLLFHALEGGTKSFKARLTELYPQSRAISLNIILLILGAQTYQLIFAQMPYIAFAALALMLPWVSVTNVLGRGNGLAAAIECGTVKDEGGRAVVDILTDTRKMALLVAIMFALFLSVLMLLSWHVYIGVRLNAAPIIPLAAILVFVRFQSVTAAAILRVRGHASWVARTQIALQWGLGIPLALVAALWLEWPLFAVFGIFLLEESLRTFILLRRVGDAG